MMFKRIDHVEIVTDQLDQTVQFYTEVLGFTVKARDRIERSGLGVPIDLVYLDLGRTVVEPENVPSSVHLHRVNRVSKILYRGPRTSTRQMWVHLRVRKETPSLRD